MPIEHMPDEKLMDILERERGQKGRDDYPVRAMWNTILAGVVLQHLPVESLCRELSRNAQLRFMCGLYGNGVKQFLSNGYTLDSSRSFLNMKKHIEEIFNKLVSALREASLISGRTCQSTAMLLIHCQKTEQK